MGQPLKSQPLVEALCEFQFNLSGVEQLTLPGLFAVQVKEEFPVLSAVNEFSVKIGFSNPQSLLPVQPQRLQLKRSDGSAMIQLGQNLLVINHLQPYISWQNLKKIIIEAFKKYVALCEEFTLKEINLRYINHILPPSSEGFKIEDFLTILPLFPKPLEKPLSGFQQSYVFMYESPSSSLVHRTGAFTKSEGETVLSLDLSVISQKLEDFQDKSIIIEQLDRWLNQAHDQLEEAFISSLNPSYYESLK